MHSHLPIELLRLIFDHFACPPISNDGTLENPHRHELLSLCLTSKIFRQLAQPLLFAVVSFEGPTEDIEPGLKRLIEVDQQSRLLEDVRLLLLKGKSAGNHLSVSTGVLADPGQACTLIEHIIYSLCTLQVEALSGSNLRKLCLTDTDFVRPVTSFCLPSLHSLSLVNVNFPEQAFSSTNFPSLRHFAYDQHDGRLDKGAAETLVAFVAQLDSVGLVYDVLGKLVKRDPSFPVHSVLVDYFNDTHEAFRTTTEHTKHARILIGPSCEALAVEDICQVIENHAKCRQLKALYLPPLQYLENSTKPLSLRQAVDLLILTCQKRDIEIVHEEQPTGIRAETQLSEEFMRRRTKERVQRETEK